MTLEQAFARQEGFLIHGTRAQRNNNPGNINWGVFARLHGATHGDDKGYAVFPSAEMGFACLTSLLKTAAYRGHTLRQVVEIYCPPTGDPRGDNPTDEYITHVSEWTGIKPDACIDPYVL